VIGTRSTRYILFAVAAIALSGCAAGRNPLEDTAGHAGVAGFWMGLWHGLICVVTFVVSLFNHNVHIYEVHNSGAWYDCGFLIGAASALGGAGRGTRSS
jgi:hypothetical protein